MLRQQMPSITLALAAMAVSLALLCNCSGRKEMSNQVIVQNELFTPPVIASSKTQSTLAPNLTTSRPMSAWSVLTASIVKWTVQGFDLFMANSGTSARTAR